MDAVSLLKVSNVDCRWWNMADWAVVTDATSDLIPSVAAQYGAIYVLPFIVRMNNQEYWAGAGLDWETFYSLMEAGHMPQTCVPPGETFVEYYTKACERHENVLAMHLSPQLSGMLNGAKAAADFVAFDNLRLYNSESVSLGLGLMAVHAYKLLNDGYEFERVLKELAYFRENSFLMGRPSTLKYLFNGGRLTRSQFLMSLALNIKVIIHYRDNALNPVGKTLGFKRAKNYILDELQKRFEPGSEITYSVMHALAPEERDEWLTEIEALYPDGDYFDCIFGPGLGAHLGPNAVAVFAIEGRLGEAKLADP